MIDGDAFDEHFGARKPGRQYQLEDAHEGRLYPSDDRNVAGGGGPLPPFTTLMRGQRSALANR
jgi:hypothetical protein